MTVCVWVCMCITCAKPVSCESFLIKRLSNLCLQTCQPFCHTAGNTHTHIHTHLYRQAHIQAWARLSVSHTQYEKTRDTVVPFVIGLHGKVTTPFEDIFWHVITRAFEFFQDWWAFVAKTKTIHFLIPAYKELLPNYLNSLTHSINLPETITVQTKNGLLWSRRLSKTLSKKKLKRAQLLPKCYVISSGTYLTSTGTSAVYLLKWFLPYPDMQCFGKLKGLLLTLDFLKL